MKFWNLTQNPDAAEDGELTISGEIVAEPSWFFGPENECVASDLIAELKKYRNVTVRINSPGGDVMAGAAIYTALMEHPGNVTVIVTALAASAASVIAMAGSEVIMSPAAYMMIHNPWTMAVGDARELRKTARVMDEIAEGLINAYQIKTGKSRDELKRLLDNETWMSAASCVEQGFADRILGDGGAEAVLMSGKAHGAQEIAARVRETPAKVPAAEEAARRAEIGRRAAILAGCYKS